AMSILKSNDGDPDCCNRYTFSYDHPTPGAKAINDIKAGKIEYRLDKANIIHVPVGKTSFEESKLQENFEALMEAIVKAKPSALKGQYLRSITLATTMGPGVKVNVAKY
ncbi:MAG: hypothetical protein HFI56_12840, partial [Lachnospiraceae bacterium]|nr:hypothetical protein [Lachnospiraceae bacterium]